MSVHFLPNESFRVATCQSSSSDQSPGPLSTIILGVDDCSSCHRCLHWPSVYPGSSLDTLFQLLPNFSTSCCKCKSENSSHCFFLQTSYASSTKYGYGDLNLSNFVVNAFIRYVKGGHTKAPYLFAVSADGKQYQSYRGVCDFKMGKHSLMKNGILFW